jgi:phosphohistidine phosphatase
MPTLYLIRHGLAVDRTPDLTDADRPLTPAGQQKTQRVAQRLVDLGIRGDRLLTSPLRRAQQTADILVAAGLAAQSQWAAYLAPGGDLAEAIADLPAEPDGVSVFVGHEPDLSTWAERLLWGQAQDRLILKKAGIIGLTLPAASADPIGHSSLFWLSPPRLLAPR